MLPEDIPDEVVDFIRKRGLRMDAQTLAEVLTLYDFIKVLENLPLCASCGIYHEPPIHYD
jgi:hypothetical protein